MLTILPGFVIACIIASALGWALTLSAVDDILLDEGAWRLFPDWFNSMISERDLFDVWIDFILENNPIMALIRLTGKLFYSRNTFFSSENVQP